jgi:hypothetical protein
MKIRFWGTHGSIATQGPGTTYFAANTSCIAEARWKPLARRLCQARLRDDAGGSALPSD